MTDIQYCARMHTIPGLHAEKCPSITGPDCTGCVLAHAVRGRLCGKCFGRIRYSLTQAPDLAAFILEQVMPTMSGAQGERVSGGGFKAPLPLRAQALEDGNDFYARLANWALDHSTKIGVLPPVTLLGYIQAEKDPDGFPSWVTGHRLSDTFARALTKTLTDWFTDYEDAIANTAAVVAWHDDIVDMTTTLNGRYPRVPRRERPAELRPCSTCDAHAVRVHWYGGKLEDAQVRCDECGQDYPHHFIDWLAA